MRFGRWLGVLGIAVLAGGIWYAVGPHLRAEESLEREFYLSSDPAVEVLKVRFTGSTGRMPVYTLHSDGTLLRQIKDAQDRWILQEETFQMAPDEAHDLVALAVHGGLMEFDANTIRERMLAAKPPVFVEDGGSMFVELQLEFYRRGAEAEGAPAAHAFSFRSPRAMAERHPEITELQALAELSRRIEAIPRQASAP